MKLWTKQDHIAAAFTACPRPCVGGRMTWQWSEPQWRVELGLVGCCTHCGTEVFTSDILNEVVINQPKRSDPQRRSGKTRRGGTREAGGWSNNHYFFQKKTA